MVRLVDMKYTVLVPCLNRVVCLGSVDCSTVGSVNTSRTIPNLLKYAHNYNFWSGSVYIGLAVHYGYLDLNCEKQGYQEVSLPLDASIYFSKFFQLLATVCLFCFFSFFSSHTLSLSFLSVLQFIFPPPCHFSATSSFALYGYLSRYNCKILTFVVK